VKNRDYAMVSGLEGILLDAKEKRNLGGMINHSKSPNAECQCVVDRGVELAIVTAKKDIPKGQQILIDYSKNYWKKNTLKSKMLESLENELPLPV
jgi:SET domain-containing protein